MKRVENREKKIKIHTSEFKQIKVPRKDRHRDTSTKMEEVFRYTDNYIIYIGR
jgi:hypothetical protein